MSRPVPDLVLLHVWRVPRRGVAPALRRVAADRTAVRRTPGVRFAKVLGTGTGRTFGPRDADLTRWALLTCWSDRAAARRFDDGPLVGAWRRACREAWRAELRPVAARGRWSGVEPFGQPAGGRDGGPVVALTRARLTTRRTARFWSAVPPVSGALHRSPGLLAALGVGEAPVGLQGTVSLWRDDAALRGFAYGSDAHRAVVDRTPGEGWYAEELFARFAVEASAGTLDGRDPLA